MNNEKIGSFIREQRVSLGLTQNELAEKLSCTDKAISRWETGKGIPDVSLLIPLSTELGVTVNEILLGEHIAEEKQLEKMDETIVNTITESKREVNKTSKYLYISLAIAQACIICALAFGDKEGPVFALMPIIFTAINSFIIGLANLKVKIKFTFPVIMATEVFAGFVIIGAAEDGLLYFAIHLVVSLVFISVSIAIRKLTKALFK